MNNDVRAVLLENFHQSLFGLNIADDGNGVSLLRQLHLRFENRILILVQQQKRFWIQYRKPLTELFSDRAAGSRHKYALPFVLVAAASNQLGNVDHVSSQQVFD